jgi:hypothetical protein
MSPAWNRQPSTKFSTMRVCACTASDDNATMASSQQLFQALVVLKRDAFIKVRQFISCKDTKNLV